ncbi:MAG: TetR/AcrR family transcriptional regulator [Polyangiaceae bacterium]|nr:TetR/AcrR family transcriptional regulator [Polyangiaceae bacterium]NUQ79898.1 TetR/AcrR family transcriptional regulator [Polyangiaceae bacterium]
MTTHRRSTEERQAEIADAALRILATRGIGALTVSALAKELGLTGGALYRHFASTDAILDAVAERAVGLLVASLPPPSLPPMEWLERFVHTRARAVAGHAGLSRFLFSDQLAMVLSEAALERLQGAVRTTGAAIAGALVAAQERGEVRRDLHGMDLVPIVMGTVQLLALQQGGTLMTKAIQPQRVWTTLRTLIAPPAGGAS